MINRSWFKCIISCLVLAVCATTGFSQHILDKRVSFDAREQRLDDVLAIISNQAGFSFSYNSSIVKRDSIVSLSVSNRTVRQVLNQLFNGLYEYKESGNYIILRRVSLQLLLLSSRYTTTASVRGFAARLVATRSR